VNAEQVQVLVEAGFDDAEVAVQGEGGKFQVRVVSSAFEGLTTVRKQQLVYACLNEAIGNGSIHAVEMATYTPEQWAELQQQNS